MNSDSKQEFVLDISTEGKIPHNYAELFSTIAEKSKGTFNQIIEELNQSQKNDPMWMFSSSSNRNPHVSSSFFHCCCLQLIEEIDLSLVKRIIVSNHHMKGLVNQICKSKSYNPVIVVTKTKLKFRMLLEVIIKLFIPYLLVNFFKKKEKLNQTITLVDTFLLPNQIEKDRYYSGLTEHLLDNPKIYFCPSFIGYKSIKELILLCYKATRSKRNFLFKEHYISFSKSLGYVIKILLYKPKIGDVYFYKYNVSKIILEDHYSFKGIYSHIGAWNNYLFFQALSKENIRIKTAIDWYENQQVDKGWNKGLRTFYPEARIKGYIGFAECDMYLCTKRIKSETEYTPYEFMFIGSHFRNSYNYGDDISSLCPAFRNQSIHEYVEKDSNTDGILVCLPLYTSYSVIILKMLDALPHSIQNKIIIKKHPLSISKESLISACGGLNEMQWKDDDFFTLLSQCKVFISSASSTTLDAVLLNKIVFQVGIAALPYNFIPTHFLNKNYFWVYDHTQLEDYLSRIKELETSKLEVENISDYYLKPTKELYNDFIS